MKLESFKDGQIIDSKTIIFNVIGNVVISQVKSLVMVSSNQVDELTHVVNEYIHGEFGFISIRNQQREVSINPAIWKNVFENLANLKAFALVSDNLNSVENFYIFEKPFIEEFGPEDFPAEAFHNVDEAYDWITKILN